jgi:hypothetical protein
MIFPSRWNSRQTLLPCTSTAYFGPGDWFVLPAGFAAHTIFGQRSLGPIENVIVNFVFEAL